MRCWEEGGGLSAQWWDGLISSQNQEQDDRQRDVGPEASRVQGRAEPVGDWGAYSLLEMLIQGAAEHGPQAQRGSLGPLHTAAASQAPQSWDATWKKKKKKRLSFLLLFSSDSRAKRQTESWAVQGQVSVLGHLSSLPLGEMTFAFQRSGSMLGSRLTTPALERGESSVRRWLGLKVNSVWILIRIEMASGPGWVPSGLQASVLNMSAEGGTPATSPCQMQQG